jgi:hypothetical protein
MLWLRKIVFYIFVLIYLIVCPLIVARMLGFVINPLTHRLVKTGLIYVSTIPPDATVYIDGRLDHQKTPTVLRDLPPGEHFIRVELGGYEDWERDIPIVAKKATVLANVLLIPDEWPIKRISSRPYQNIIKATQDILIATNPVLNNIDIFHTTQGIQENFSEENAYGKTPLFPSNSIYAYGQLTGLYSDPNSPFILLEATIKNEHNFLLVNVKENPPVIQDITNIKDKATFLQNTAHFPIGLGQQPPSMPLEKFLINDKNDLLTREGNWVRIYPNKNFGKPQAYDIGKSRPETNMYFEEKSGELFYLDDDTGFLFVAQILPYHPVLNIPIPESLRTKMDSRFRGNDMVGQK